MTKRWLLAVSFTLGAVLLSLLLVYAMVTETFHVEPPQDLSFLDDVVVNNDRLQNGMYQFKVRCSTCHGFKGEGSSRAPSLADEQWLYGDTRASKYSIIFSGSPTRRMKGWGSKLRQEDLVDLVLFIEELPNL